MRVIARLDIKNSHVIKGVHLEGLRQVGDPFDFAAKYYSQGADELILMDAVASLYDRNALFDMITVMCQKVFIPITVGGGIRTVEDIKKALHAGADKVAINTAAILRPDFITEAAYQYGSQCVVGSIEAKRMKEGSWLAYRDNGRERTALDVVAWAKRLVALGAGEILLTSIDCEGTRHGFDVELARAVDEAVTVPVVLSGGMGALTDLALLRTVPNLSAVACASVFHYGTLDPLTIKKAIARQ